MRAAAVTALIGAVCAILPAASWIRSNVRREDPGPVRAAPAAGISPAAAAAAGTPERAGVDWRFIRAREGGQRLRGYVPGGRSGVTIATGVDLGQRSRDDILRLGVSADLSRKLLPYALKRGRAAAAYLETHALVITRAEAAELDRAVQDELLASLRSRFDRAAAGSRAPAAFSELPPEAQTVIASVAFQYGPNLKRATPRFWRYVTRRQWREAVEELEDFGDAYDSRRAREAELLRKALGPEHRAGDCDASRADCC
jgi:hypothetical protein